MQDAVDYVNNLNALVFALVAIAGNNEVNVLKGRKYDRVAVNGSVRYFIDKANNRIYGAKSDSQHNPRREFGTLFTLTQMDWESGQPKPSTALAVEIQTRENAIAAGYKQRGRPRKPVAIPAVTP